MIKELKYADHEEWLEIRKNYVGGSDASAIVGMNNYRSAYNVWAEKLNKVPAFEGNLACEVGTFLEEFVAQKFAKETGKKVRRKNFTMVNDLYPFAAANVDRLIVGENAGLECKTTSELNLKNFNGQDFPEIYYCQCVHYLAVTGKDRWYLAVLIGNKEFKIYCLERDEDEIKALMEQEKLFWECVQKEVPPEVDGSKSTTDTLTDLYNNPTESEVDLNPYETDLETYMSIKARIKELENDADTIANRLRDYLGNSTVGYTETGFKVSWKPSKTSRFDKKLLAKEHPEINLDDYTTTTETRRFLVNKKKEK